MIVKFEVPGKIQGKGRALTVTNKYTKKVHSFTPSKTENYENFIRWCYTASKDISEKHLGDTPFMIVIYLYFKTRDSYSKKKKNECLEYIICPTIKPDVDNNQKVVLDSLNGIAYNDDKNCVASHSLKLWDAGREYALVKIYPMDNKKLKLWSEMFTKTLNEFERLINE